MLFCLTLLFPHRSDLRPLRGPNLSLSPGSQNPGAGKEKEAEIKALAARAESGTVVNFERNIDLFEHWSLLLLIVPTKKSLRSKRVMNHRVMMRAMVRRHTPNKKYDEAMAVLITGESMQMKIQTITTWYFKSWLSLIQWKQRRCFFAYNIDLFNEYDEWKPYSKALIMLSSEISHLLHHQHILFLNDPSVQW